jgi:hypothetical protein
MPGGLCARKLPAMLLALLLLMRLLLHLLP